MTLEVQEYRRQVYKIVSDAISSVGAYTRSQHKCKTCTFSGFLFPAVFPCDVLHPSVHFFHFEAAGGNESHSIHCPMKTVV